MDITGALANYMSANYGLDVARVVNFYDSTESGGYCETCYYEYAVFTVDYVDSKDERKTWTYRGSFAELIREL